MTFCKLLSSKTFLCKELLHNKLYLILLVRYFLFSLYDALQK